MLKILALDLATNCGWCHNFDGRVELGTWPLASAKEIKQWGQERTTRKNDPRVWRLFQNIESFGVAAFDFVVFEDVEFQSYTQQCQLWSSLRAAVWLSHAGKYFECVPVATLKKFATGHGAATKEMMVKAAVLSNPTGFVMGPKPDLFTLKYSKVAPMLDDNAADAYHLFRWAQQNLGRVKLIYDRNTA